MAWDRVEAERLYIQNPEPLSLGELAKKTNRHKSVIGYWKNKYDWDNKRSNYWKDVTKLTLEKSVEKVSDILSEEAANLALAHLRHYQEFRKFGETFLKTLLKKVSEAEDPTAALLKINPRDINYISQLCDRAIKGESAAIGLHQQIDPAAAARTLESMGYIIVDPSESIEVKAE